MPDLLADLLARVEADLEREDMLARPEMARAPDDWHASVNVGDFRALIALGRALASPSDEVIEAAFPACDKWDVWTGYPEVLRDFLRACLAAVGKHLTESGQ